MGEITEVRFDGIRLRMYDSENNLVSSVLAVSGRQGAQNPSLQNIRDVGTIPEGSYTFSTRIEAWWRPGDNEIQVRDDENWHPAWGNFRVALHPESGTETFGRTGFYLRGSRDGNGYGSAGCIDVNTNDGVVFGLLMANGASDIRLVVEYGDELANGFHPVYADDPNFDSYIQALEDRGIDVNSLLTGEFSESFANDPTPSEEDGSCFGGETLIDMWPLDPSLKPGPNGIYDQDEVRAKTWKKPIELIRVDDIVVSFDEHDNLVPGTVTRTFKNDTKILHADPCGHQRPCRQPPRWLRPRHHGYAPP